MENNSEYKQVVDEAGENSDYYDVIRIISEKSFDTTGFFEWATINKIIDEPNTMFDYSKAVAVVKETLCEEDSLTVIKYLDEIERLSTISEEGLIKEFKNLSDGDKDAAERIATSFLGNVVMVALEYANKGILIDLIKEGNLGLAYAIERYDYKKGFSFQSYMLWFVHYSIISSIEYSGEVYIPVHMREISKRTQKIYQEMEKKLGRKPTIEELREYVETKNITQ